MKPLILACVFAALGSAAVPASALTYVTYTGTIGSGVDSTGLFTEPSTDLSGYSFTAVLTIDPTVANVSYILGGVDSAFTSGSAIGSAAAIDATLTVNGRSVSIAGNYLGTANQENRFDPSLCSGCYDEVSHRILYDDPVFHTRSELSFDTIGSRRNMVDGPSPFEPLDFTVVDPADRVAIFSLAQNGGSASYGSLLVDHIAISDAAPVPEPGEWAMTAAGLAIVGGLVRRQKNRGAA